MTNLVGSAYQVQVVLVQELRNNVRPKGEGDTSVVLPPGGDPLLRITPDQVTEEAWAQQLLATSGWEAKGGRGYRCLGRR